MRMRVGFVLAAASLLGAGLIAAPAGAQPAPQGFTGEAASSVAGCPYIVWRLARDAGGAIHGIAYYSDLSGLSEVSGSVNTAGQFHLVLTKTSTGNGPVGTVDGTKGANGALQAKMTGEGCANMTLRIRPVRNLNDLVNETGGNAGGHGGR